MPASKKRQTSIAETFTFAPTKRAKHDTTTSTPAIIDLTRSEDEEIGYEGDDLDDADFLALEVDQKLAANKSEFNDLLPTRMTWVTPNRLPLRKIRG